MKKLLICVALIATSLTTFAQVGVGTTNPHASAALDVESTTQGFLPPRMTQAQIYAIANPAEGLIVYCLDCSTKGLYVNDGADFVSVMSGTSANAAAVAAIVTAATNPAAGGTPSIADLTAIGVNNLTADQTAYEEAIADAAPAPTTVAEIQAIVDAVNTAAAVASVVADASNPAAGGTPSIADLTAIGVNNLTADQIAYEEAIADAAPAPTTVAELQTIVDAVNTAAAVASVVADASNPAAGGTPSIADLTAIGVNNLTADQIAYEEAIADAAPAPTTVAEIQAIVDAVNTAAVASVVTAATNPAADGTPSIADLTAIGVNNLTADQIAYEEAIADAAPAPTTVAEIQAIVDAVNTAVAASDSILAQIGTEGDNPDSINSVVTVAELGMITPAITGIDPTRETDYQNYIDGNPGLFSEPATQAEVQAMLNAISATDVVSTTGKIWMDRNLGATQQATSSTDAASYGDLYQWGRSADGHQIRTSSTVAAPTTVTSADPGHGDFILTDDTTDSNWTNFAGEDDLWQAGLNDPCPTGYRIPTETEFNNERLAFGTNNAAGAASSALAFPVAGSRYISNGTLANVGSHGLYWSSTVSGTYARYLNIRSTSATMSDGNRGAGFSVRCIKE